MNVRYVDLLRVVRFGSIDLVHIQIGNRYVFLLAWHNLFYIFLSRLLSYPCVNSSLYSLLQQVVLDTLAYIMIQ